MVRVFLAVFAAGSVCLGVGAGCSFDSRGAPLDATAADPDGGGPIESDAGGGAGGGPDAGGGGGSGADGGACEPQTCEERGWACGRFVSCGEVVDCADEGRTCDTGETCIGGVDEPTECVAAGGSECEVCDAIPECGEGETTRLSGRVLTPGRSAADVGNQVGVPNALVYILQTSDAGELPAIPAGLPSDGGTSCDRCEDQAEFLGPFLAGAVTDASGRYELEGDIPVGEEIIVVVKAGKFRRATTLTLPADDACSDIALPESVDENPTRLPRSMGDGLAVNIPRIAVSTGEIDAMECVFEKIGIEHDEFGNPDPDTPGAGDGRIHLYRGAQGSAGMRIDGATPADTTLYESMDRLEAYDVVIADCEGGSWDGDDGFEERDDHGDRVREYVNRGGRLFASHLSMSWLHENGVVAYDPGDPVATGLGPAASWTTDIFPLVDEATTRIALDRPQASPSIDQFAAWMETEGVTSEAQNHEFDIDEPRSLAVSLGDASEEFVFCPDGACAEETQQFSFNTPYAAPETDTCGRVAYSGFHVVAGDGGFDPYADAIFPDDCDGGAMSDQEKVLLFMLFDLARCIGDPLPPECEPRTCGPEQCGQVPDGCGDLLDCGDCPECVPSGESCDPEGEACCDPSDVCGEDSEGGHVCRGPIIE